MNKKNIIEAFVDKILGIRNYKSDKKEFLVNDFLNEKLLDEFLDEVYSGESDITPAGKSFLKNYFGFEELAASLFKRNPSFLSIESSSDKVNEVKHWLENLEPMGTIKFIEETKGGIEKDAPLKGELLPPKEFVDSKTRSGLGF